MDDADVGRDRIRLVEGDITDSELAVDDYESLQRAMRRLRQGRDETRPDRDGAMT